MEHGERRIVTDGDGNYYLIPEDALLRFEAWLDGQIYEDFEQYQLDSLEQLVVTSWFIE